jgi:hypothetical protein
MVIARPRKGRIKLSVEQAFYELFVTLPEEHVTIYSSEISVDFHLVTQRYIPDDRTLHSHRFCEIKHSKYIYSVYFAY